MYILIVPATGSEIGGLLFISPILMFWGGTCGV
jgi:hypothetical protein